MAFYRKTTPSSYPNTPVSNFTDSSKNWRKHSNMYRKTSGNETASLTAVPGRYTDDTRTWRRIKAMYRRTSSGTWQKIFSKFAGQPYPETPASIRYNSYTGTVVGDFAEMGPGSTSIAEGSTNTTFLWGRDAQDWQNIETLTSRTRTFVNGSTPVRETSQAITNDEGNFDGDKLRNSESVILQYDGKYVWYRDRITLSNGSTGTSYSQTVRVIKQQPAINTLAFKTNNTITAGSRKDVSFSIANQWYRSIDKTTSMFRWYILDSQYETPTQSKLWNSTSVSSVILTENTTVLTGEDFFTIPTTFGGAPTTGKWLYVELRLKNSSSNTDVDYALAPYNDVTGYVVAQIGAGLGTFSWSILNGSTAPTIPSAPTLTQSLNDVYVDIASTKPANTGSYTASFSGSAIPSSLSVSTGLLNLFGFGPTYNYPTGPYETYVSLSPSANNSPLNVFVTAEGSDRKALIVWGASTSANSYKINYTISGATAGNGTFNTGIITETYYYIDTTANGGTVTVNSVTAYAAADGTGASINGTVDLGPSLTPVYKTENSATTINNFTYLSAQAPTSLTSSVATGSIVLTFSGGSGTQYDLYYDNVDTRPADGAAYSDFPNVTSPYTASSLTPRNITRYFWVRKKTSSIYSNWYPASSGVTARLPLLAPNPPRTLTVSNITTTNITINWLSSNAADDTHDAVASYDYYTSTTNSIPATPSGNTTGNSVSFTYTASATPQIQYFWVRAKGASPDFATSSAIGAASATPTALANIRATGNMRRVTMPVSFTGSSQAIWVCTNGYVSLTVDPTTSPGTTWPPAGGVVVGPAVADMKQVSLFTFADSSNYYVRWRGHGFGEATNLVTLDYLMKFYWNSTTVDVYFITNITTASLHPSSIYSGTPPSTPASYALWENSTSITGMTIPDGMVLNTELAAGTDDNRTALLASPPVLTWTVTWDAAGGGEGTQFTTQNRGLSHTAPDPGTRSGFDFAYYRYPASGGTDPAFVSIGGSYTPTSSVTFGAIWATKTYSVSYNANEGTGAPASQTKTHGVTLTLSSTTPTRATVGNTSYAFNGWNTASDGTGTNYSAGGSYTENAAVTLYAKWTATTIASATKLATPTGVSASRTFTDKIRISWTAVSNASSYGVWYRGGAPSYNNVPDFPTTTSLFLDDTSVGSGVERQYDVQAYPASGSTLYLKSDWGGPSNLGLRATATVTPATAPGTPGTPTNGWTGGVVYPFSWTAPSSLGTVSGGSAATISSYQIKIYRASSSSGTGSTLYNTYTSTGSGLTYTFNAPDGQYYAASVSATNSAGLSSASYSGISLYK